MQATKGAASVIARVPMLRHTDLWGDPSYWDIGETKGAARGGVFLWDCDFPGNIWNTLDGYANLSFGTRTLVPGNAYNLPFVVVLSPGHHRFEIRQVSGAFFFESLTAWAVVPQPVPEALG